MTHRLLSVLSLALLPLLAAAGCRNGDAAAAERTGVSAPGTVVSPGEKAAVQKTRIGVFDSRAIVVAYTHSKQFDALLKSRMAARDAAKAAGDTEKVKELEAGGAVGQRRIHRQGFGTASVRNLLECVEDRLPEIARAAGVDLIVSKWDVTFQGPSVELVDVTAQMVEPFEPNARARKIIAELAAQEPLSEEELERLEKTHDH